MSKDWFMKFRASVAAVFFVTVIGCSGNTLNTKLDSIEEAMFAGDAGAVEALLKSGHDANGSGPRGIPYVHVATGPKGRASCLRVILEAGADPDTMHNGYTPLMNAASWLHVDSCRLLVQYGASITTRAPDGRLAIDMVGNPSSYDAQQIRELLSVPDS